MKLSEILKTTRQTGLKKEKFYRTEIVGSGFVSFTGTTKEESEKSAQLALREQLINSDVNYYLWAKDGVVFHLYYNWAWVYEILRPGKTHGSLAITNAVNYTEAKEKMATHFKQYDSEE